MKKILFYATMVAMVMAMAMPVQAQSRKEKKAAKKEAWEMRQKFIKDSTERANKAKLEAIDRENKAKEDADRHAQEIQDLKAQNEKDKLESQYGMDRKLASGVRLIYTPCMDDFLALNLEPDYMAAQGIATSQPNQETAEVEANRVGIADITTRLVGVIKNGVEHYAKDSSFPTNKRSIEAQLEGLAVSTGEMAIKKLYSVKCRDFTTDKYMQYNCYEALFVPVKKVLEEVANEAAKQLDIDKALFRKHMEEELENNRERENADLERQRKELER